MSVVLVSGATRGIGRAVVEACLARGDSVVGIARDAVKLRAMRLDLGDAFIPVAVDLADRGARAELVARIAVDAPEVPRYFVSAAGNAEYRNALDINAHILDSHFDLHVVSAFEIARDLASIWITNSIHGSIVLLSSTLSQKPAQFTAAYAIAKGALDSMVGALAFELAPYGIRINSVAPGVVDTELVRTARPDGQDPRQRLDALASVHPLGRLGTPKDVATSVLHVLHAEWMTGSRVVLDGGLSLV